MDEISLFKQGMRRVSGAVTIVTTLGPRGERRGVTATAVCSLTAEPPAVIACIHRETSVGQLAPLSGIFCVNVLALDQRTTAETFAGRSGHVGEERFRVGAWARLVSGAPTLEGALACFDCRLERFVEFSSHLLLVGAVSRTLIGQKAAEPLIYVDGGFTTATREIRSEGRK
jgi:flavin reductase (DIM6/NTAB) family NADH-FMN oxidoreductase RutF